VVGVRQSLVVLVAALAACYRGDEDAAAGATTTDDGEDATIDDGGSSDSTGAGVDACGGGPAAPLRRLTTTEYRNSIRDLLGVDASDLTAEFPIDATVAGFANNSTAQAFQLDHARAYESAATAIAQRLVDDADLRASVVGCTPAAPADGCVREFVERFAATAWRRPVEASAVDALVELAAEGEDGWAGVALVVRAVLQSPHFLFRVERHQELDGWEIAARLSYLLWQSTPDAGLLARAADGSLADAQGVVAAANEALARAEVDDALADFASGWLRLAALDDIARDPARYPEWTPSLRTAMRDEAIALVRAGAREHGLLSIYTLRRAWIDDELAEIYGLPSPGDADAIEIDVTDVPDRGGLLTTAAVLALTTPTDVTSPVRRGAFVLDALLCTPPPPPPPGAVGELPPPEMLPKAEALAQHRADPSCAGCHDLMDPIGLGLERYDALGRVRTHDEGGWPVVLAGTVPGVEAGEFGGGVELGERLRELPAARRCVATQMFRWAMGRSETPEDACVLDELEAVVAETDGDHAALVAALVASDAFRFRP
jgi:hypothetical protein